jgi:hypothetical protein
MLPREPKASAETNQTKKPFINHVYNASLLCHVLGLGAKRKQQGIFLFELLRGEVEK